MGAINERDKNVYLDALLKEDEEYSFKIYGAIEASMKDIMPYTLLGTLGSLGSGVGAATGALQNKFCYMGVTQKNINFVVLETFHPDRIEEKMTIPLSKIAKIKRKISLIPSQTFVIFEMTERDNKGKKIKMKFRASTFLIGSDIKDQKEGVLALKVFAMNYKKE